MFVLFLSEKNIVLVGIQRCKDFLNNQNIDLLTVSVFFASGFLSLEVSPSLFLSQTAGLESLPPFKNIEMDKDDV